VKQSIHDLSEGFRIPFFIVVVLKFQDPKWVLEAMQQRPDRGQMTSFCPSCRGCSANIQRELKKRYGDTAERTEM